MKIVAQALLEDTSYKLGLQLLAGSQGLTRTISNPRIQKPGLAIAGLVEAIVPTRVQVLGNTELMYLHTLSESQRTAALSGLFQAQVPCVIVTSQLLPLAPLTELAEQERVSVFVTELPTGTFIARLHAFFDEHLSPRVTLHGVLMDVFGVGVMLTGHSGIGKSECALDLILRGHRLVADDSVLVRQHDQELIGMGSPLTKNHMEVRGLGIINVKDLFGAASVCERKEIELIIDMVEWQRDGDYDRLGLDDTFEMILDVKAPRVRIPIRPGRNVSSIVEVATRNFLLKAQGHHAARKFQERLALHLAQQQALTPK